MRPAPFASTPERVAEAIVRALMAGLGEVWVSPVLRWLFSVLRLVPSAVWRRMPR